ncbi:hypothetical protein LT706_12360 [Pseudomonas syringae pv. syringae]|uniref:hypothetical protein n=1 Tax=Pseudomonas syringae TaxID=317 RepID=UPI00200A3C11|nr:hypothetical protein [Pseudomonas syringae]MCK9712316.1 hypothetical protein [Pseudomonas syringae pv. syringae]
MTTRAKTFMTALNNPQPREQVLIAYLAVTMLIAGVYQTAQITDPIAAVGVPDELAPLLVVVIFAPILAYLFRNLQTLHSRLGINYVYTDEVYQGLAKLGHRMIIASRVGGMVLKLQKVSLLAVGVALLIAWFH